MSCPRFLRWGAILLGLQLPIWAEAPTLQVIQKAYERAAFGAELKYVDGMLACRTWDYRAFTKNRQEMDLTIERERFAQFFVQASRVRLNAMVQSVRQQGDETLATVDEVLQIEQRDQTTGQFYTNQIKTRVEDRWVLVKGKPRLKESTVLEQRIERGPALEADKIWTTTRPQAPFQKKKGTSVPK